MFGSRGTWVYEGALCGLIYQLTAAVVQLGLVRGVKFIPLLFFSPIAGSAADRYSRKTLLLFSQATTLPIYYAASVVMALGQSIGGANAFTLAIVRWFVRLRGNAMSIIITGNCFGYVAKPALPALRAAAGHDSTLSQQTTSLRSVGV